MSGGVDSSVAAGLLLRQGYEVLGVTMRLWTSEDAAAPRHQRRCCSVEDTDDARAAADALGIRHYVVNLEREFSQSVVSRFVQEYALGRTPNPCLACNEQIKFRPLLEHAVALGAGYLATGHYARVRSGGHGAELWRAADQSKDQTYVLYTLGQRELSRTLFPVGDYLKNEIRAMARRWRLPNAGKPDSADICFIPSGDYRAFVRERVESRPGEILDAHGLRLGEHQGIIGYTVGQRRGVPARGGGAPLFVLEIDPRSNTIVAGGHDELMAHGLVADELSFVADELPAGPFRAQARVRYRSAATPCTVEIIGRRARVRFETPQRAVTPGQAVVFYDGDRVLGGGTILSRLPHAVPAGDGREI
jgi:tRNA-specific 2-thiouridylase